MTDVHIHLHFHGSADDRERNRMLHESIAVIRENVMTISPQIQKAIDAVRQTRDLTQAVLDADKVQTQQISTLTDKVTELQAKVDAGGQISTEDMDGLAQIVSDVDLVNSQLRSAVPANTEGQSGGSTEGSTGTQTPSEENTGNPATGANVDPSAQEPQPTPEEIAARGQEASDAPKPLAGTGLPNS